MANITFQRGKTESPETIDSYVSDLAARLKHQLPEVDADEIVAETHAHLTDRVTDLVAQGSTDSDAQQAALAGFGSARVFAGRFVDSAIVSRTAMRTRLVGSAAIIGTFCGAFAFTGAFIELCTSGQSSILRSAAPPFHLSETAANAIFLLTLAAASAVTLCAFLSRKSQTRAIFAVALAALALTILPIAYVGPGRPANIETYGDQVKKDLVHGRAEIAFLQRRISIAKSPSEYANLPYEKAILKPKSTQIVDSGLAGEQYFEYEPAESLTDARAAWQSIGPTMLAAEQRRFAANTVLAEALPEFFNWRALNYFDSWIWVFPFAAALIAVDRIAAWAGRRAFLESRRRCARRKEQAA